MNIINVTVEDCLNLVVSINLFAIVCLFILVWLFYKILKKIIKSRAFKSIKIEETTIGIGNSSVTIKYDGSIKEIAYKIWVELTTRKIGIEFDEKYDVINEVYDSWYEAFKVIRQLLEDIPGDRLTEAKGLIELTTKVLNNGLRPHLTKWQAKYGVWYRKELETTNILDPQEIQKKFPEYKALIEDLKSTNNIMIKYTAELKRIIDGE